MADPCVEDTIYIGLDTTGSPAVLAATLRNPETTHSDTQGDYTTHTVTDDAVTHTQTQTSTIDNSAGTAPCRGIVVVSFDDIWVTPNDPGAVFIQHAELRVAGAIVDERNKQLLETPIASGVVEWLPTGVCLGQVNVAAGATVVLTFTKTLRQVSGSAKNYSFVMGGDKIVTQMGY